MKIKQLIKKSKNKKLISSNYELACILWENASNETKKVNISRLINRKTKFISFQHVKLICEKLKCTPNDIFDY